MARSGPRTCFLPSSPIDMPPAEPAEVLQARLRLHHLHLAGASSAEPEHKQPLPSPPLLRKGGGGAVAVEPAPGELVAILEALKRAGALRAELEIIQGWAWRRLPGFGKASACNIEATAFRPLPFAQQRGGPGRGRFCAFGTEPEHKQPLPSPPLLRKGGGQKAGGLLMWGRLPGGRRLRRAPATETRQAAARDLLENSTYLPRPYPVLPP